MCINSKDQTAEKQMKKMAFHRMLSLLFTYPDSLLVSARNKRTIIVCLMNDQPALLGLTTSIVSYSKSKKTQQV